MAKKRKRRGRHQEPRRPTVVRRHVEPIVEAEDQPLMQSLRRSLASEDPLDLLLQVSTMLSTTQRRPGIGPDSEPAVSATDLMESLTEIDLAQTTAALHVMAAFDRDEVGLPGSGAPSPVGANRCPRGSPTSTVRG